MSLTDPNSPDYRQERQDYRQVHGVEPINGKSHFFETPERTLPMPSVEVDEAEENQAVEASSSVTNRNHGHNSGLIFQKGVDKAGHPFFTIYQPVAHSALSFPRSTARKTHSIRHDFATKAVLGVLVLKDKLSSKDHILKTAISTNDSRPAGPSPTNLLYKPIWRTRVKHLAVMMNLKLGSLFDGGGKRGSGRTAEKYGRYNASHVEKKLSAFALYMMLEEAGIVVPRGGHATVEQIRALRRRMEKRTGGELAFEIVVSRKWCTSCLSFVRRLCSVSGLRIRLRARRMVELLPEPRYERVLSPDSGVEGVNGASAVTGHDMQGPESRDVFEHWELDIGDSSPVVEPEMPAWPSVPEPKTVLDMSDTQGPPSLEPLSLHVSENEDDGRQVEAEAVEEQAEEGMGRMAVEEQPEETMADAQAAEEAEEAKAEEDLFVTPYATPDPITSDDDDATPPPPSDERVAEFAEHVSAFAHDRRQHVQPQEPLFRRRDPVLVGGRQSEITQSE